MPVDAGRRADVDGDVVQQSGAAESGRHQHRPGPSTGAGSEPGVPHLQVVDLDRRHLVEHGAGGLERLGRAARAAYMPASSAAENAPACSRSTSSR